MAQYGDPYIVNGQVLFHVFLEFEHVLSALVPFGNDYDTGGFSRGLGAFQGFQKALEPQILFRDQNLFRPGPYPGVQGDMAGIPSHDLHEEEPVVGTCGVPYLVHGLDHGIDRRVESKGVGGPQYIIVYGTGNPDDRKTELIVKGNCPLETSVTPYHYKGINAFGDQLVVSPLPSFLASKIIAAGRF